MPPGIVPFNLKQMPAGVVTVGVAAGAASWRMDATFLELPDSSRRFFTTLTDFVPDKLMCWRDGTKMVKNTQYIQHPPNVIEFVVAPLTGQVLETWHLVPLATEVTLWQMDEVPAGLKNSLNTDFTTFFPYVSGLVQVYRNGRKLIKGVSADWVEVNATTIRIAVPPVPADDIEMTYMNQV